MDRLNSQVENIPGQLPKRTSVSIPLSQIYGPESAASVPLSVDEQDAQDPQCLGYYAEEIHMSLLASEYTVNPNFMQNQPHVNHKMRAILIDWMVSMHLKFRLLPETLYLSVHLVDRYLEKVSIQKKHLQLLGIASLLIASKYEEIYPPQTRNFIACTDQAYNKQQLLTMENDMLRVFEFNITVPSILRFLERYARLAQVPANAFFLAKYISELALIENHLNRFKASIIALCSLYIALKVLKLESLWEKVQEFASDSSFSACAKDTLLVFQVSHNHPLSAVRDKYARVEFGEVSKIRLNNA